MTQLTMTVAHYIQYPISEILSTISELPEKLRKRAEAKQAIKDLSALSDHQLRDMGLCRGDIHSVVYGHSDMSRTYEANNNLKGFV